MGPAIPSVRVLAIDSAATAIRDRYAPVGALVDRALQRLLDRARLTVRTHVTATDQGGHRSKVRAGGLEFADHRPYVPGDDVRHVDWKAFARTRQLVLRQYTEERNARVYMLIDGSGSMSRGSTPKTKTAALVTTSIAYVAARQFDRVLVIPFDVDIEAKQRPALRGVMEVPSLEARLEARPAQGETAFGAVVRAFGRRYARRGLVVVVSDLLALDGFAEGVRTLGALGHEVHVIHVGCDEDMQPDLKGEIELTDSETGARIRLRVDRQIVEAYLEEVGKHLESIRSAAVRAGGRFVAVRTGMKNDELIRELFGRVQVG